MEIKGKDGKLDEIAIKILFALEEKGAATISQISEMTKIHNFRVEMYIIELVKMKFILQNLRSYKFYIIYAGKNYLVTNNLV